MQSLKKTNILEVFENIQIWSDNLRDVNGLKAFK